MMRDKKLERQAPLPTRTMRRDGRLIFFSFPLFFFPAPCKLFFSPLDSYPKSFLSVAFLQRRFCPPRLHSFFLLRGQLHQRPAHIPSFWTFDCFVKLSAPHFKSISIFYWEGIDRDRNEHDDDTATEKKDSARA